MLKFYVFTPTRLACVTLLGGCALLAGGCGGGGSVPSAATVTVPQNSTSYTVGTFAKSSTSAAQCAVPRTGTADKSGSITLENFWLRSWSHELYLWYAELPDLNPANYTSTETYFNLLKTSATTSSGTAKDRFHFTYNTADWLALSQSGVSAGYGAEWVLVVRAPPREMRIAFVEPSSPAASAGLARGMKVISVDSADLVNGNTQTVFDTLNAGLSPSAANQTHTFVLENLAGVRRTVSLTSANITSTPVQNVNTIRTSNGLTVGYILFNDHIATSEQQLVSAFNTLRQANASDLILDLRYNGGGYLDIASEVAYMIAGDTATSGKTFERLRFNSQYPVTTNPVTGGALSPTSFLKVSQGFSGPSGVALPTLNLPRVLVLTGSGTCSASEAILNGLRGVGITVIQIGSTTCGKPYGFYPQDNCGTTYFTIEFDGVNEQGNGGYSDGFSPSNSQSAVGVSLPGCSVADDFTHALGDVVEGRLAAALAYRQNSVCPGPASGVAGPSALVPR